MKIALAGNPNSGKTTLFNDLTGSDQYVGNWPGVTVEKKDGILAGRKDVVIQDLPGIYSLSPYSLEEVVARNYLVNEKPDAILNIVDGSNLERNLYLTTQLLELGLPEGGHGLERPAAMHDSCGARGDEQTQKAIREIARRLGCELTDTPYSGDRSPCCGYGGLTAYANREVAQEMTEKCLERSDAPYISYCMACRDRFARQGRESRHILELVYGTDAGAPPDISEKRYNRLTLKNELLRELWLEEPKEMKLDYELRYTDEARQMMDERMILTDDVIAVIDYVRKTGECIEDEDGLLVARCRVGNATFWLKFSREGDGSYLVHRAWSHRMQIVKREG